MKLDAYTRSLPKITRDDLLKLTQQGHVWHVYARKRIVSVDGFKKYRLVD